MVQRYSRFALHFGPPSNGTPRSQRTSTCHCWRHWWHQGLLQVLESCWLDPRAKKRAIPKVVGIFWMGKLLKGWYALIFDMHWLWKFLHYVGPGLLCTRWGSRVTGMHNSCITFPRKTFPKRWSLRTAIIVGFVNVAIWFYFFYKVSVELPAVVELVPQSELDARVLQNSTYLTVDILAEIIDPILLNTRINEVFILAREIYDFHAVLRGFFFGYFFILIMKFFKTFQAIRLTRKECYPWTYRVSTRVFFLHLSNFNIFNQF